MCYIAVDLENEIVAMRSRQIEARKNITVFKHPIKTLYYFALVCHHHIKQIFNIMLNQHCTISLLFILLSTLYVIGLQVENPFQDVCVPIFAPYFMFRVIEVFI